MIYSLNITAARPNPSIISMERSWSSFSKLTETMAKPFLNTVQQIIEHQLPFLSFFLGCCYSCCLLCFLFFSCSAPLQTPKLLTLSTTLPAELHPSFSSSLLSQENRSAFFNSASSLLPFLSLISVLFGSAASCSAAISLGQSQLRDHMSTEDKKRKEKFASSVTQNFEEPLQ